MRSLKSKRSVSKIQFIVALKINLLASKGNFLFPYRRICKIVLSGAYHFVALTLQPHYRHSDLIRNQNELHDYHFQKEFRGYIRLMK